MASRISHNLSTSFDIPVSSLPITIAVGPLRSASNSSSSLFSVAATIRNPSLCNIFSVPRMLPARHTGIRLSAPAELFIDSAFTGAELLSDVTSPWAPAHSALRAIAPKLRTSVTPSSTTSRGVSSPGIDSSSSCRPTYSMDAVSATAP